MRFSFSVLLACVALGVSVANACPFCSAPSLTLTEQLNSSEAAVLVQWKGGKPANLDEGFAGTTTYEVVRVVHDATSKLKPGETLQLDRYRAGKSGDLFVLLGTVNENVEWSSPLEVTETTFNYMTQAPTKEEPASKRLSYFLKFLEYSDSVIANDAYAEFANAPYADIVAIKEQFPKEKLRKWLVDPQVNPTRIGLYGMMLGLCGEPTDAEFLEKKILEPTDEFRLGIDGVMGGYLLLTGSKGLDTLVESKLAPSDTLFSETFAAMQALRFMWTYGDQKIPAEDLRKSMRVLLGRPNLADLVIVDLARWQDWGVMAQLVGLYNEKEYDIPSIKRAIVRFLMIATKADTESGITPQQTELAQKSLDMLRESDPKTVKAAEKYFFD
ncbi:MAG: hypothetical protein KDA88_08420 [Planctomycetaceae bacterium]|nr:hypothetical protein [Planctomycetaceae bacterium]MCB9950634.1 hypothetical protein [Planctomycetaceae bacterium]